MERRVKEVLTEQKQKWPHRQTDYSVSSFLVFYPAMFPTDQSRLCGQILNHLAHLGLQFVMARIGTTDFWHHSSPALCYRLIEQGLFI